MNVLYFTRKDCQPCKTFGPMLENYIDQSDLQIELKKFLLDDNQDPFIDYSVKTVPTIIILDEEGEEIKRGIGAMNLNQMQDFFVTKVG